MDPRRDEVVPRTFRRRLGEDRRFDLEKIELGERTSRALQQAMTEDQIRLQLGAAQIEMAILETQLLGRQFFTLAARDRNRRCLGGAHNLEARCVDLDIAGRELGVAHRGRARNDLTLDGEHRFGRDGLREGQRIGGRPSWSDRHLNDPVAIAEVEEDDSSQVAAPVDPPPQSHALPDVFVP